MVEFVIRKKPEVFMVKRSTTSVTFLKSSIFIRLTWNLKRIYISGHWIQLANCFWGQHRPKGQHRSKVNNLCEIYCRGCHRRLCGRSISRRAELKVCDDVAGWRPWRLPRWKYLVSRIGVRKTSHMSIQPELMLTDYASNKSHLCLSLSNRSLDAKSDQR